MGCVVWEKVGAKGLRSRDQKYAQAAELCGHVGHGSIMG